MSPMHSTDSKKMPLEGMLAKPTMTTEVKMPTIEPKRSTSIALPDIGSLVKGIQLKSTSTTSGTSFASIENTILNSQKLISTIAPSSPAHMPAIGTTGTSMVTSTTSSTSTTKSGKINEKLDTAVFVLPEVNRQMAAALARTIRDKDDETIGLLTPKRLDVNNNDISKDVNTASEAATLVNSLIN